MRFHNHNEVIDNAMIALSILKAGNKRFVEGRAICKQDFEDVRNDLSDGQNPFSVIITCSDSRVAPEIFFDQKLGNIFVIRNAGNICDNTVLGSIEYAVEHLKSPLVVVCGHTSCGAVTAALQEEPNEPENIHHILDIINTAHDMNDSLDVAIQKNVIQTINEIRKNVTIVKNQTTVIGAIYDIESGIVDWI